MKCPNCGKEIANDSQFCEFCGAKINFVAATKKVPKNYKPLWITLIVVICVSVFCVLAYNQYENSQREREAAEQRILELEQQTEKLRVEAERKRQEEERIRQKKERAERKRIDALKSQGWIDLGLPSGTLWKDRNEPGGFYTESQIVQFGRNLPSKKQFEELINSCQWNWMGDRYEVVGPNGESITLAALGATKCWGEVYLVGTSGFYWSSTPDGPDRWWDLYFSADRVEMFSNSRCDKSTDGGHSVRLIK